MAQHIHFTLKNSSYIALCDLLKVTHVVQSGGEAKIRIDNGEVYRNGEVETRKRAKIISGEIITYHNISIQVSSNE